MKTFLALALLAGLQAGCAPRDGGGEPPARNAGAAATAAHDDHAGHDDHGAEEAAGGASADDHEGHDDHAAGESVALTPAQRAAAGIALAVAGPGTVSNVRVLPGEVVLNADALAHIVPRFPGVAREVRKRLGDRVKAGEVLAVINSNESLSSYEVLSLIDGVVIEKHITLGEFVQDDQDIYVVADLSTVWVNLTVYPRDLDLIRTGLDVTVEAAGVTEAVRGTVSYVGPIVGEATRTAIARVVLGNGSGRLRPGLFVSGRVAVPGLSAGVVVSDAAVQTFEGGSVVFIEGPDGRFTPRPVTVGRTDGVWTEVLAGLEAGETYVRSGAFLLKSELLKSEAGHDH